MLSHRTASAVANELWDLAGMGALAAGKILRRASCSLRFTAGSRKGFDTRDLKDAKALLEELAS
jgi:hypothetical protein